MRSRPLRKRKRGQAYVEFLIVLPGVMLLTLLAWEFAYFWWGRMVVATGTFEAARQVASGEPVAVGYAVYDQVLTGGLGNLSAEHQGHFSLYRLPGSRSVRAQADVPWHWPSGLARLMGGDVDFRLRSSAFFRQEEFWPGPSGGRFE